MTLAATSAAGPAELAYILSEGDHRLNQAQDWAASRLAVLRSALGGTPRALDFSDDRLASGLDLLSDDSEGPIKIAEGFECAEQLTATLADGRTVTWTERRLVVRSLAQAAAATTALHQRLAQAETALLALTRRPQVASRSPTCRPCNRQPRRWWPAMTWRGC